MQNSFERASVTLETLFYLMDFILSVLYISFLTYLIILPWFFETSQKCFLKSIVSHQCLEEVGFSNFAFIFAGIYDNDEEIVTLSLSEFSEYWFPSPTYTSLYRIT